MIPVLQANLALKYQDCTRFIVKIAVLNMSIRSHISEV